MASSLELGVLTYSAYTALDTNKIPTGDWVEQNSLSRSLPGGFAAKVYKNSLTNEVVVAFRGTDTDPIQP
jgi:hypothetical protein